jgi:large subunit ribosomal protein L31
MQKNIHPKYHEVTFNCNCGHQFKVNSTIEQDEVHLDICSHCHPFFTGQQRMVDTAGRVEKFRQRYAKKTEVKKTDKKQKA